MTKQTEVPWSLIPVIPFRSLTGRKTIYCNCWRTDDGLLLSVKKKLPPFKHLAGTVKGLPELACFNQLGSYQNTNMIKLNRTLLLLLTVLSVVTACNNSKKEARSSEENKSITADPPAAAEAGMTIADANKFLDENEANTGKEITVTAYSWGYNEMMGGMISLNLGDKKLEGMKPSTFSCKFVKADADAVKAIAKDSKVTVSGKIGKGSGGTELTDCKLLQ